MDRPSQTHVDSEKITYVDVEPARLGAFDCAARADGTRAPRAEDPAVYPASAAIWDVQWNLEV